MDSPEGFAPNPVTGTVVIALTSNSDREVPEAGNPRANNRFGHLPELRPPVANQGVDHAAAVFRWDVLVLCGDPGVQDHAVVFHQDTSRNGWFTEPDNIGFDPRGRLWVCTDGVPPSGHDALYAMDMEGPGRGLPKLFYAPHPGRNAAARHLWMGGGPCFSAYNTRARIHPRWQMFRPDGRISVPACRPGLPLLPLPKGTGFCSAIEALPKPAGLAGRAVRAGVDERGRQWRWRADGAVSIAPRPLCSPNGSSRPCIRFLSLWLWRRCRGRGSIPEMGSAAQFKG